MINKLKIKIRQGFIRHKAGFTLIETLVAILILVTAIAGPLTIASKGLSTALVAKDQTTAYYLAQDAVEYVRFARDTNRLQGNNDWLKGAGGSCSSSNPINSCSTVLTPCTGATGCYFDSLATYPSVPTACEDAACSQHPLYYDATNHNFNYNTNNALTIFTRTVSIVAPVGTNDCVTAGHGCEAALTVSVSWSDLPGFTHTITVHEDLFNWQ
jgi:prepilin-type N-terminal cleavage/methylation domain-containing protein